MKNRWVIVVTSCVGILVLALYTGVFSSSRENKEMSEQIQQRIAATDDVILDTEESSSYLGHIQTNSQKVEGEIEDLSDFFKEVEMRNAEITIAAEEGISRGEKYLKKIQIETIKRKMNAVKALMSNCHSLLDVMERTFTLTAQAGNVRISTTVQKAFGYIEESMYTTLDEYMILIQLFDDVDDSFGEDVFKQRLLGLRQQVLDLEFADEFDFEVHRACVQDVAEVHAALMEIFIIINQ